jgi:hypothetical protein
MDFQYVNGAQCSCKVLPQEPHQIGYTMEFCPMHKAASRMLEALKEIVAYGMPGTNPHTMEDMADLARAAIAEAE